MLAKSSPDAAEMGTDQQGHPVIRTLYDHGEEVTCLEFHPKEPILASGSRDNTVKLFDFSKAAAKKAFRTLTVYLEYIIRFGNLNKYFCFFRMQIKFDVCHSTLLVIT